jgi:hypothetical protein
MTIPPPMRMTASTAEEQRYVETCERQLTIASSQEAISQTAYADFVTLYCRDSTARGPACSDALQLFQDLPLPMQLAFFNLECSTEPTGNSQLACPDAIPHLCASTYELMLSSNLLLNERTTSSEPESKAPTAAPARINAPSPSPLFSPLVDSTKSDMSLRGSAASASIEEQDQGLSIVAILGISMTGCFVLALAYGFLWKRKQNKLMASSDDPALQGDESVSSENSQQFSPASQETADPDDEISMTSSNGSWFRTTPRSTSDNSSTGSRDQNKAPRTHSCQTLLPMRESSSVGNLGQTFKNKNRFDYPQPLQSSDILSPSVMLRSIDKTTKRRCSYPLALSRENLSQDNPVHARKRFSHHKDSSFSFDEKDCSRTVGTDNSIAARSLPARLRVMTNIPLVEVNHAKLHRSHFDKENAMTNDFTAKAKYTVSSESGTHRERVQDRRSVLAQQHNMDEISMRLDRSGNADQG